MSYVGDQAQQGYYPDPHSPSTSTTHLLNPNGPLSPLPSPSSASFAAIQSRPGGNIPSAPPSPVHAAFRGPPSKRSSIAGSSIFVRREEIVVTFISSHFFQNGPPPVNPYEAHGRSSSIASKVTLSSYSSDLSLRYLFCCSNV